MNRYLFYCFFFVSGLLLCGCWKTTNETNPNFISMGDLWFGSERLDSYLDSRQEELVQLQKKTDEVELRLAEWKRKLSRLDNKLNDKLFSDSSTRSKRSKTIAKVKDQQLELKRREKEVEVLRSNIRTLRRQLTNNTKAQEKRERIMEKIVSCEIQLEDLEKSVDKLENSIKSVVAASGS